MNYLAKAKIDTPVFEMAGSAGNKLTTIKAGDKVNFTESSRVGLKTYYKIKSGGYVSGADFTIIRDEDFYYQNYYSKNLVKKSLGVTNVNGLRFLIGEENTSMSPTYNWLQRFDSSDPGIREVSNNFVSEEDGRPGERDIGIPNIFGGISASDIEGTNIYQGNSKTNLLRGVTVGDVLDGSALGIIAGNLFDNINGWINNKLEYVIGFDDSSILGQFFKIFGTNFATVIGYTLSTLLGIDMNDFLNPLSKAFSYKSQTGSDIWKASSGSAWSASYEIVPTGPIDNEVRVYKSIWNADYSEFQDALTLIKQEFNIDVGRNKSDNIYTKFDRFRVAVPDHELTGSVGHIFFVRPDLNIGGMRKKHRFDKPPSGNGGNDTSSNGTAYEGYAHYTRLFKNLLDANPTIALHLMKDGFKDHNFMPLLTHACAGIDVADEILETTETGETFVGWKYMYGTSMIKSKTAGTINVMFTDDNILSVYKLMKTWIEYIHAVHHGEIFPKDEYVMKHQLDYPTSIYYILTDATGEAILFWTKYLGAFPISSPSSNFSDSIGNRITRPNYSIQFAYARKDDFNPLHLEEFNRQSTGSWEFNKIYNEETLRTSRSFLGAPFVDTMDGELTYRLRFRPPPTQQ